MENTSPSCAVPDLGVAEVDAEEEEVVAEQGALQFGFLTSPRMTHIAFIKPVGEREVLQFSTTF